MVDERTIGHRFYLIEAHFDERIRRLAAKAVGFWSAPSDPRRGEEVQDAVRARRPPSPDPPARQMPEADGRYGPDAG
jgi:hypothetical protein